MRNVVGSRSRSYKRWAKVFMPQEIGNTDYHQALTMSGKEFDVAPAKALSDSEPNSETASKDNEVPVHTDGEVHFARRGELVDDATAAEGADGFDAERMRGRSLLTAAEEKALMRRVDWRMMTICSMLFLLKNIDADNISNARIMNRGTPTNIMTQLKMTSDQYNLLTVLYYVNWSLLHLHWL